MGELETKIQAVLNALNTSFDVVIEDSQDVEEQKIVTKIILKDMKNDGSELIETFCSLFGPLVEQICEDKELVFEEGTGLTIRRTK